MTFELAKLLQEFHENLKSLSAEQAETVPQKYKEKQKPAKESSKESTQQKQNVLKTPNNEVKVIACKTPSILPKRGTS